MTGAGGFIGSHLVEELCSRGVKVRALCRYTSRASLGWLDGLAPEYAELTELEFGDIRDAEQMRRVVDGCDTVFHLAALIGIPYSYVGPRQNLETNAVGTLNLLEAARAAGVSRFVQISSSEVYGSAQYVPMDEAHPLVGQSPYAATKIAADQLTISYARSFGLPTVIVRPFNTFGPRQSLRAVIPTVIAQSLFSDRIKLGSLNTSRDFTFVRDTARGMIAAAATTGFEGEVFNLGTGEDISIGDLVEKIQELVGSDLPIESSVGRVRPVESEVDRLRSDPSKARTQLGWSSEFSLAQGLQATIDWMRTQPTYARDESFSV